MANTLRSGPTPTGAPCRSATATASSSPPTSGRARGSTSARTRVPGRRATCVRAASRFNSTPIGVNSVSPAHLHVHPMGRSCIDELAKSRKIHIRTFFTVLFRGQARHAVIRTSPAAPAASVWRRAAPTRPKAETRARLVPVHALPNDLLGGGCAVPLWVLRRHACASGALCSGGRFTSRQAVGRTLVRHVKRPLGHFFFCVCTLYVRPRPRAQNAARALCRQTRHHTQETDS